MRRPAAASLGSGRPLVEIGLPGPGRITNDQPRRVCGSVVKSTTASTAFCRSAGQTEGHPVGPEGHGWEGPHRRLRQGIQNRAGKQSCVSHLAAMVIYRAGRTHFHKLD